MWKVEFVDSKDEAKRLVRPTSEEGILASQGLSIKKAHTGGGGRIICPTESLHPMR